MPSYEVSASIAAQREAVWSVLADVSSWAGWTPTVLKVEALDAPGLEVGHRFRVHQPELRRNRRRIPRQARSPSWCACWRPAASC